jgi:uncharacterized protein YegP (UPF0339 family)
MARVPHIIVYKDKAKGFRWRFLASNGKIVADSAEAYTTAAHARVAAQKIVRWAWDTVVVPYEESTDASHQRRKSQGHR